MGRLGPPCRWRAHGPGSHSWRTPEAPGLRGWWGRCSPDLRHFPGRSCNPEAGGSGGGGRGGGGCRAQQPLLTPPGPRAQAGAAPRSSASDTRCPAGSLPPPRPQLGCASSHLAAGRCCLLASSPLRACGHRAVPLAPTQPTQARCASSFPAQSCPCPHLPRAAHQPARPTPSWALGHLGELLLASTACSPARSPRLGSL